MQHGIRRRAGRWLGEHDAIDGAERTACLTEMLAHQPLEAAAGDRPRRSSTRHRHAQSRLADLVGNNQYGEKPVGDTLGAGEHPAELGRLGEPGRARERQRTSAFPDTQRQGVRRRRPFARRRASTLRPFLVAMRARKPCVRLRRVTLGWNVLFITDPVTVSVSRGRKKPGQAPGPEKSSPRIYCEACATVNLSRFGRWTGCG